MQRGLNNIKLITAAFFKFKMMMGDRTFFISMIVIPLLIMIAAGYALSYEKLDVIPVAAVDEDDSEYSSLLIERVSEKEGINLYESDRENALSMLDGGKAEQVFIIGKGFQEAVKNGENEGLIELISSPSSYSTGFVKEVIAGEAMRLTASNMAANSVEEHYTELGKDAGGDLRDEALNYAEGLWEPKPLMTVDYRELKGGVASAVSRTRPPASSASSAGLLTAFVMFYMLFGSGWLIEERTNGTIKRLGAGNGAVAASFGGSVLALLAAGTLQVLMFCVILKIFFGISLFSGAMSYFLLFAYLLAVAALCMFLSSILKTQAQLQAGGPVFALFTGFAGGCFWNFIEMPGRLAELSLLTPQGWALKGLNSLLLNPADFTPALAPFLVLLATALILLPLSYIIINMQLRV